MDDYRTAADWRQTISIRENVVFRGFEVRNDECEEPEAEAAADVPDSLEQAGQSADDEAWKL